MARIRSLHPGLFTDERYMSLSLASRELIKGIWCEADDQGVFDWKPLTLKARILPADAVDVPELLAELIEAQFIIRFEIDGHAYGAVRNFRKFQRPKKPNHTHLLPSELRTYVAISDSEGDTAALKPPPVPHQFPTGGGKLPQMEDVGGSRKEKKESGSESQPLPEKTEPSNTAQAPSAGYAFAGKLIRLTAKDFAQWRKTYSGIPDLAAELSTLDAYYDAELSGDERKRWFVRCSSALDKKHQEASRVKIERRASGGVVPMHPGAGG